MKLTPHEIEQLSSLANALFPLDKWFPANSGPARPFVPPLPQPWRSAAGVQALTIASLDVIRFLAAMLQDDAEDTHLAERWHDISADPLQFQVNSLGRVDWRSKRVCKDDMPMFDAHKVTFGAAASGNFVIVESGKPVTRSEFYSACLPHFMAIVSASPSPIVWRDLARNLIENKYADGQLVPRWPSTMPSSLEFVRQLCKDIAYAAMNFQSPAGGDYPYAFAIETGEQRRPGNAYGVDDAKMAILALQTELAKP
jgi:hypothetical protein